MGKEGEGEDGSCPLGIWESWASRWPLSIQGGCLGVPKEVGRQSLEKTSKGRALTNNALAAEAAWEPAGTWPKRGWMPSAGLAYALRAGTGTMTIPASPPASPSKLHVNPRLPETNNSTTDSGGGQDFTPETMELAGKSL